MFCVNMCKIFLIFIFLIPSISFAIEKADSVLVIKSEAKLYLMKDGKEIMKYHCSFGANPTGHKRQQGDERTPEGKYILDYKKKDSAFYKAIHISYPNDLDKERAKNKGVNPGGAIMIHGQKNNLGWLYFISKYFHWTDGCIAVSNSAMDEIWEAVDVGTPIEIRP
jgi:murein L,D-transpeptidase YafK